MTGPTPRTLPEAFEAQVGRTPGGIAIRTPRDEVTYSDLNGRANRIARAIAERSIADGHPAAILLTPGIAAIAGVYAGLKAGLPVLSLDPASPPERHAAILRDSDAGVLVVDRATREAGARAADGTSIAVVDASDIPPATSDADLGRRIDPDAPATIVYTSGSTGAPKGVVRTHRIQLTGPTLEPRRLDGFPGDRQLMLSGTSFANASGALFNALLSGATIYPFRIEDGLGALVAWIRAERITRYRSVPPLFREVMRAAGESRFPDVRAVHLSGDAVFRRDFELFRRHFTAECTVRLSLGMSEATGAASRELDGRSDPGEEDPLPVGVPAPGVEVRLVDESGAEVAPGETGEIEIASRNLPLGYWKNPSLTARRYRDDPRGGGWRIFRSGDLGRWTAGGLLQHRGRIDFQTKIRGQRVDTTEVEAILRHAPTVVDAAVLARGEAEDLRLVAYLAAGGDDRPSRAELRRRLRERVPEAAVPSAYVFLESLPRTANGKTDRRALPAPAPDDYRDDVASRPPADDVEAALAEIWSRILPARVAGVTESFFDLGGDSLRAAELLAAVERRFGQVFALPALLDHPTIEQLAAALRAGRGREPDASLVVALQSNGSRLPFFCVPGGNGPGFNFRTIARLLGADQPFYAFHVSTELGHALPGTMAGWASRFLEEVLRIQPRGPYRLGGHSFGGHVAYEMGRLLHERGETVAFVALLDTYAPGYPARGTPLEQSVGRWGSFLRRPLAAKIEAVRRRLRRSARRRRVGGAMSGYVPRPFEIPLVLFRATERDHRLGLSFVDPDNGWRGIAGDRLRTHPVDGNHDTLIEGAGADEIARWLSLYLSEGVPALSGTATGSPRADTGGAPSRAAS
jgi:amino acid adenylation domain-containing protein